MTGRLIIAKRIKEELDALGIEYKFGNNDELIESAKKEPIRYSKCSFVFQPASGTIVVDLMAERTEKPSLFSPTFDDGDEKSYSEEKFEGYSIYQQNNFLEIDDKCDFCNHANTKLFNNVFVGEPDDSSKEDIEFIVSRIIERILG